MLKKLILNSIIALTLVTSITTNIACAEEFDPHLFDGIDMSDGYNVIGETGGVQSGEIINKHTATVTFNIERSVNYELLSASDTLDVIFYKDDVLFAETTVDLRTQEVIESTVNNLSDGKYICKIEPRSKVISVTNDTQEVLVKDGLCSINLEVLPSCILYIKDATELITNIEFMSVGEFNLNDVNSFAVKAGKQYKIRSVGETNYITIQIPTAATEYTYTFLSASSVQAVENTDSNKDALQPAELPENVDIAGVENPYNIPPTLEINDIDCNKDRFIKVLFLSTVCILASMKIYFKLKKNKKC